MEARTLVAGIYTNLSALLGDVRQFAGARQAAQQALQQRQRLHAESPSLGPVFQRHLAVCHTQLGHFVPTAEA